MSNNLKYKWVIKIFIFLFILICFGCNKNATEPESDPDPLTLQLIPTHVSVYGGSDGSIDLAVSGGTSPYQFQWSNGETIEDINNLIAGTYSVLVTDVNTETITDSTTITEPEEVIPLDGRGGGVIAYCYQPLQNGIHQIFAINANGSGNKKLIQASIGLNHHDWSPDGQKIACVGYLGSNNTTWSIHVFDVDGTNLTRLTNQAGVWDTEPAWSPDGTKIAFTRMYPNQNNREELWVMDADGSNQMFIGLDGFAAKWSSDGTMFIYSSEINGNYDIYTCLINGTDVQQVTETNIDEWYPNWSPNGSQIAFNANTLGDYSSSEIYIMDSDGMDIQQLTYNSTSDAYPRFSPDGSFISFTRGDLSDQQVEVFIMSKDGTDVRRITNSPVGITAINAVWQPVYGG